MKKITSLFALLFVATSLSAQTMYVCEGSVRTAVSASQAGTMHYTNGTTLTIGSETFQTSEIDSIVFDNTTIAPQVVSVTYSGAQARVVLPLALRSQLKATVSGAYVDVVSTSIGDPEIVYALSGTSADGSFTMDGDYKSTVNLNGLTLTSQKGAAIDIKNGKRIGIVLVEGTTNTLADKANGLQDACFFVNGHAEFSGAGSLVLTGNVKHAFKSDEYTLIKRTTGRIEVLSAKGDGLNCGQYFEMNGGRIIVNNTKGDCIQAGITKTKTDERNGQLLVHGGTMNLNVVGEDVKGLKSDSLLTITGGTITIAAKGNGSKGISSGTDLILNAIDAVPVITITATGGQWIDPAGINNSKCMGMKVSGNLFIYAGTIDIHATGTKSKSIKVDGNLSKSANATIKVNPLYEVLGVVKDL